jgi:hypothetical protein
MATTKGQPKRRFEEDPRFGKARNEEPPDPFHDSTSIAKEPPRLDVARRRELEEEERARKTYEDPKGKTSG